MRTDLKQLIPGNPGTSFVVALLYVLNRKYKVSVKNDDQISIFTKGMSKSRKVFFSGVLNEIASQYKLSVSFLTNGKFLLKIAQSEINKDTVSLKYNQLSPEEVKRLINKHVFVVLSVDLFLFKPYHDYHFVAVSKGDNGYQVFEPKSGEISNLNEEKFIELVTSIDRGLKDVTMAIYL